MMTPNPSDPLTTILSPHAGSLSRIACVMNCLAISITHTHVHKHSGLQGPRGSGGGPSCRLPQLGACLNKDLLLGGNARTNLAGL